MYWSYIGDYKDSRDYRGYMKIIGCVYIYILGLYRDNGKANGNNYSIVGSILWGPST